MADTIRQFAERLLFASTLEEKLLPAGTPGDEQRGPGLTAPDAPGRPPELRFRAGRRVPFEKVFRVRDESEAGRGRILHYFANHELLACELMALLLLRFPEAPPRVRAGLLRMIGEEQKHLSLYLTRMRDLGVAFGELALNDFFWKLMRDLDLPGFVAAMNLTFEQANLDWAASYGAYFERIGDEDSAAIMRVVLAEEIGHVRGGLAWFRDWKDPGENDWTAYRRLLPPGLSPARAKGRVINREARRAAGLDDAFIDALAICADSRGHPPRVFLFDPSVEEAVGAPRAFLEPRPVANLRADLETLPFVFASAEDVVLVDREPSDPFRLELAAAGFELPRFVTDVSALDQEKISGLQPWGWSPAVRARLLPLFGRVTRDGGPLLEALGASFPSELFRSVYSKAFGVDVLGRVFANEKIQAIFGEMFDSRVSGRVVRTPAEIDLLLAGHAAEGRRVVLKQLYSAAGRHRIFPGAALSPDETRHIQKQAGAAGGMVLEPYLDRVMDLSWHGDLLPNGAYVAHGSVRFIADARGRYRGSFVGFPWFGLPAGLRRFLGGEGNKERNVFRLLEAAALVTADILREEGYRGPFAIDALLYRHPERDGEYLCKPIVEVNARYTMGRVARELARRIRFGALGLFGIVSHKEIETDGFAKFDEFARDMRERFPLMRAPSGSAELIDSGFLPLADPAAARQFLPVFWCGPVNAARPAWVERLIERAGAYAGAADFETEPSHRP